VVRRGSPLFVNFFFFCPYSCRLVPLSPKKKNLAFTRGAAGDVWWAGGGFGAMGAGGGSPTHLFTPFSPFSGGGEGGGFVSFLPWISSFLGVVYKKAHAFPPLYGPGLGLGVVTPPTWASLDLGEGFFPLEGNYDRGAPNLFFCFFFLRLMVSFFPEKKHPPQIVILSPGGGFFSPPTGGGPFFLFGWGRFFLPGLANFPAFMVLFHFLVWVFPFFLVDKTNPREWVSTKRTPFLAFG